MSRAGFYEHIQSNLDTIRSDGLWKREREITSPQAGHINVGDRTVINLCANNYLGFADDAALVAAATEAMNNRGFGMASVRFICGTNDDHRHLEREIAEFVGKDDCITFAACFDANGAVFEPLLTSDDAIVSDCLLYTSDAADD